jgi:hypothetical protein
MHRGPYTTTFRLMARENMEEYGSSAWVELETVKSVVEAYAAGEIELPPLPEKTKKTTLYVAPRFTRDDAQAPVHHPYTRAQVAQLVGWTRQHSSGGVQPNHACETAFRALELIERGLLKQKDCHSLTREQPDTPARQARYAPR